MANRHHRRHHWEEGAIYIVDYLDHSSNDRMYERDPAIEKPSTLRCIGRFVRRVSNKVPPLVQLEHWRITSDSNPANQRIDFHEVIEKCIIRARKIGKETP